jgi:hypothetical protein
MCMFDFVLLVLNELVIQTINKCRSSDVSYEPVKVKLFLYLIKHGTIKIYQGRTMSLDKCE